MRFGIALVGSFAERVAVFGASRVDDRGAAGVGRSAFADRAVRSVRTCASRARARARVERRDEVQRARHRDVEARCVDVRAATVALHELRGALHGAVRRRRQGAAHRQRDGRRGVVAAVDAALAGEDVELLVARSHAHGDHTGGEADLASRPKTTLLKQPKTTSIDLGNRVVDVIPIPGHEASHVAYYDGRTRVLLTGDTLYPGRLYVRDFAAYKASIERLATFADTHPVSLVLGAHVELSKTGAEFALGSKVHPSEHPLSLGESDLRDLHATTDGMTSAKRVVGPRWIIVPVN